MFLNIVTGGFFSVFLLSNRFDGTFSEEGLGGKDQGFLKMSFKTTFICHYLPTKEDESLPVGDQQL